MKNARRTSSVLSRSPCWAFSRVRWHTIFLGFILATLGPTVAQGRAAGLSLTAELLGAGSSVRIHIQGDVGTTIRLESSSHLAGWQSRAVLENATGTLLFVDPEFPAQSVQFYRAVVVDAAVLRVVPEASPGGFYDLPGDFALGLPGEVLVRFGGLDAEVIGPVPGGLRVRVPTQAISGLVTARGIDDATTNPREVVVTGPGPIQFQPPAGVNANGFRLINAYGVSPSTATTMTFRRERPLLTIAAPTDTNRPAFFLAVSVSGQETNTIDATSTVQALIFMSPPFYTPDPTQARRLLATLSPSPPVQALSRLFSEIVAVGSDPLASVAFEQAFRDAVQAVLNRSGPAPSNSLPRRGSAARQGQEAGPLEHRIDDLDTDYLVVTHGTGFIGVNSAPINHLDWVVTVSQLDVTKAFPGGRNDYQIAAEQSVKAGADEYRRIKGFRKSFIVRSSSLLEGADISSLVGQLVGKRFGVSDDPRGRLDLPGGPALYVLRGVSPAFDPAPEAAFVQANYHDAYLAAVRINLLAAAVDLLGVASEVPGTSGALTLLSQKLETVISGLDTLPPIKSAGTFLAEASDLAGQISFEYGMKKLADASTVGAAAAGQATGILGRAYRWISKSIANPYDKADKLVDLGKIALRAYGVFKATPLESAFLEVGDAFQMPILKVKPGIGAIGDTIEIGLEGRRFGTDDATDRVWFANGAARVPAADVKVTEVENGNQTLEVKVPMQMGELYEAATDRTAFAQLPLVVSAGGFRGSAPFTYVDQPTVTGFDPAEGFAASASYLGSPFPGTGVRLRGFGFGPGDRFFFHQTEGTNKSGSQGDVTVSAPVGAVSGSIEIVPHSPLPSKSGFSSAFKVLGPPVILSHGPANGPAGTAVRVALENLGVGPAVLTLNGIPLSNLRLFSGEIAGTVPFGAESGLMQVVTPAGISGFNFVVEPGLATGALLEVGGDSLVTLQRAFDLAGHVGDPLWTKNCTLSPTCIDDEDVERTADGVPLRGLDPPVPGETAEEGDFITDDGVDAVPRFRLGKEFANTITLKGTVVGNVVLGTNNVFETLLSGDGSPSTIEGALTIDGSFNHLLNLVVRGRLLITGNYNTLDAVVVTGSQNEGIIVQGHHNILHVTCISNTYDGLVIDGGQMNQVEVLTTANGNNGVTLKGGAHGNQVAMTTGFLPTPGGLIPFRGNAAHGLALLEAASENQIQGLGPIARNQSDGAYLSGLGVVNNQIRIFHSQSNGVNGFTVRDGAASNVLDPILAEGNGGSGVEIRNAPGTVLRNVRSGLNRLFGVRIIGGTNIVGPIPLETRGNLAAGLRLEAGTVGLVSQGTSTQDALGVELVDAATSLNVLTFLIEAPAEAGAALRGASQNRLALRIRNGLGVGLILEGGANQNEFPRLQINRCATQGLILRDHGTAANLFPDPQIGLPILGEAAGNGGDGVLIENGAAFNVFGDATGRGPEVRNNGGVGIRIRGATSQGNRIQHSQIHEDVGVGLVQQSGLVLEAGVTGMIISDATITGHPKSGLEINQSPVNDIGALIPGATGNHLLRNGVGLKLTGAATTGCRVAGNSIAQGGIGVLMEDRAAFNEIGTDNRIGDNAIGIRLDHASHNRVFETLIRDNSVAGLSLVNGASDNLIRTNRILRNGLGIDVSGNQSVGNRITLNSITANLGLGIRLSNGGNHQLDAPTITGVGHQRVTGSAFVDDGGSVELFADSADEGERFLGSGVVVHGEWVVAVDLRPADVGTRFQLHATVTDFLNDTSEFGDTGFAGGASPLVFVSTRDGNRELYQLDGIDESVTRLTTHPADDYSPSVAPQGGKLVFVSTRDGNPEIYRMELGGTNPITRLTMEVAADYDPTWRPDGTGLAFVSERAGNPEIYLANIDGTGVARITTHSDADRWPSFSPDGSRIVFASRRSGNWDLWIVNSDGTNPQSIGPNPADDTQPVWSPDGTWIAFVSSRDGNPELYLIHPDGSELQRLTDHPSTEVDPSWLNDSHTLLFASDRDAGFELYQIGIGGGEPSRLTISTGNNTQPKAGR